MSHVSKEIRAHIGALTQEQRRRLAGLLETRLGRGSFGVQKQPKLVAYWTPRDGAEASAEDIRAFLADRLPDYMIPAAFVQIDTLPRTPGGKLNRQALPAVDEQDATPVTEYVAPRNETEAALARIWQEVLGLEQVSVHEDFFEVGGDSLLSIRILARARRKGIEISCETFFAKPTIATLAASITAAEREDSLPEDEVRDAPLTPIQHWFFENIPLQQSHWNQSFLLAAPAGSDLPVLERLVAALLANHDALRVRFERNNEAWRQIFVPSGEKVPVRHVSVAGASNEDRREAIAKIAAGVQAQFDFSGGPLIQFVLFDPGPGQGKRLLIVAHHLLIDGVSWGLLLEDLDALYRRHQAGEALSLPLPTASYGQWARRLAERASEFSLDEGFWLALPDASELRIPVDHAVAEEKNLAGTACVHAVTIGSEATQALLGDVPQSLAVRPSDLLLTALLQAWTDWSGDTRMLLDLEGHGRDVLADELDVSRTIGWFTVVYPALLVLDESEPRRLAQSVRRQLETVESKRAGHGLLRYLSAGAQVSKTLAQRRRPQVLFNFMGRADSLVTAESVFRLTDESHGPDRHPEGRRAYLLEINGRVERESLRFHFEYHPAFHDPANIELLAQRFAEELNLLASRPSNLPPEEFSLSGLDAEGIDRVSSLLADLDTDE